MSRLDDVGRRSRINEFPIVDVQMKGKSNSNKYIGSLGGLITHITGRGRYCHGDCTVFIGLPNGSQAQAEGKDQMKQVGQGDQSGTAETAAGTVWTLRSSALERRASSTSRGKAKGARTHAPRRGGSCNGRERERKWSTTSLAHRRCDPLCY